MKVIPIYSRKRSSDNGDHHQIKRMKISSTPGWSPVTPAQPPSSSSTPRVPPPPHSIARPRIVPIHSSTPRATQHKSTLLESNTHSDTFPTMADEKKEELMTALNRFADSDSVGALTHVTDFISGLQGADIASYSQWALAEYKKKFASNHNRGGASNTDQSDSVALMSKLLQQQSTEQKRLFEFVTKKMENTNNAAMTSAYQDITTQRAEDFRIKLRKQKIHRSTKKWLKTEEGGNYLLKIFEHGTKSPTGYDVSNPTHINMIVSGIWNELYGKTMTTGTKSTESIGPQIEKIDKRIATVTNAADKAELQTLMSTLVAQIQNIQHYQNALVDGHLFTVELNKIEMVLGFDRKGLIVELVLNALLDDTDQSKSFMETMRANQCDKISIRELTNKLIQLKNKDKNKEDKTKATNGDNDKASKPDKPKHRKPKHKTWCKFERKGNCSRITCEFKHHEPYQRRRERLAVTAPVNNPRGNAPRYRNDNIPQQQLPMGNNGNVHPSRFGYQ
eukprot:85849_1